MSRSDPGVSRLGYVRAVDRSIASWGKLQLCKRQVPGQLIAIVVMRLRLQARALAPLRWDGLCNLVEGRDLSAARNGR